MFQEKQDGCIKVVIDPAARASSRERPCMKSAEIRPRIARGKVVVLTGASSGFGRGAALAFARAGAVLVLAARRGDVLDEVTRSCIAEGAEAHGRRNGRLGPRRRRPARPQSDVPLGRIDVWINNAGSRRGRDGSTRFRLHDHAQVIETTLLGTSVRELPGAAAIPKAAHGAS